MRTVIAAALLATSLAASLTACSQKDGAGNGNRQDKSDRQERRAERREGGGKAGGGGKAEGGNRAGRFDKLDSNKDGSLDQSEAPERMQRRFSRLDNDGDGKISRDEFTSRGR